MGHKEEGLAALRAGDAATAARLLNKAAEHAPADPQILAGLGVALCQQGRAAAGAEALEKAIALTPGQAGLHYNLGRAYELQQRLTDAERAYRSATALAPDHQGAAEAVRRLGASAAPPPPGPTPASAAPIQAAPAAPAPTQPSPAPSIEAHGFVLPGAHSAPAPPAWGVAPSPLSAIPPLPPANGAYAPSLTPAAIGAAGAPYSLAPPPSSRSGFPWLPVILGLGGIGVLGVIGIVVLAILLPAFAQARKAARSAAVRNARSTSGAPGHFVFPDAVNGASASSGASGPDFGAFGGAAPDLHSTVAGPRVNDRQNAFSITLPGGFQKPGPMPHLLPLGMAGLGRAASYDSPSTAGECFVMCLAFPNGVFDQMTPAETFQRLRERLASSLHSRVTSSQQGSFAGNPSEDTRLEGGAPGNRYTRVRMIHARPRLLLVAYSGANASDPDAPAVNQYFDSLQIRSDVSMAGLNDPIKIPEPHFATPPAIPQPRFTQPDFPQPHIPEPPQLPQPTFPRPHFGPPSGFGGDGNSADPNGGGRFGPHFGPGFGPRFGPPGAGDGGYPGGSGYPGAGGNGQFGGGGYPGG